MTPMHTGLVPIAWAGQWWWRRLHTHTPIKVERYGMLYIHCLYRVVEAELTTAVPH